MGEVLSKNQIRALEALGICVSRQPGRIISRQRCPVCGVSGDYTLRTFGEGADQIRVLFCANCMQFPATLLEIRFNWQRKTRRITHNEQGERLTTYDMAEAALGEIRRQIRAKTFNPAYWSAARHNELLFMNFRDKFMQLQKQRVASGEITQATYDKRRSLVKHSTFFDHMNLREINAGHIKDWVTGLKLAQKTKLDLVGDLGLLFQEAVDREMIKRAPRLPKLSVPKRAIRWLTAEAQATILDKIAPAHRPIFLFMMEYGCRIGEACALQWGDIDWLHSEFVFRRCFSRRRLGTTTKQRRDNPQLITGWFEQWLKEQPRGLPDQPVFKNLKTRPHPKNPDRYYREDTLNKLWKEALEAAEFEPIKLYNAVRHSRGNQARRAGMDPVMIARLLGHASTKYVNEYYVDTDTEMLRKEMDKTDRKPDKKKLATVTNLDKKRVF